MNKSSTPLPVIAEVSRIVTQVVDRIMGNRVDYPLMVAAACVEALRQFDIKSHVMYGQEAWLEILEDHSVVWAGCWGDNFHFWVATEFEEVVDLNASVAYKKKSHDIQFKDSAKPIYSPPMLWSEEIPNFYRFIPEGIAELELTDIKDQRNYDLVVKEIREKCKKEKLHLSEEELDFPNEPILCPGRKLLDDSRETFKHFDRVIGIHGVPQAPKEFSLTH